MDGFDLRFPTPPATSPSFRPKLGIALSLNTLLAAGVHLGMSFGSSVQAQDELTRALMMGAPVIYLALLLPIVATYGLAAAAWTGWSWWRCPIATLAGATMALGMNAWIMAKWIARQGWEVGPILASTDPRVDRLLSLAMLAALTLGVIALSMWPRWFRDN